MLEMKQTTVESFFTRGRQNNCSCIYISQNYHKLPRQTIRTNTNVFVLFFSKVNKTFSIFMTTMLVPISHGMSLSCIHRK